VLLILLIKENNRRIYHIDMCLYYLYFKRLMDFVLSLIAIIILFPLFLVVALLILIEDGGPVFYVQDRVGKDEVNFRLLKFRSMINRKRFSHEQTFSHSSEVTKIGRIIRRFKIDELPQLFNVIKGDLSLVGPRPCLPETALSFGNKSKKRHSVRPGLSGLSQINGNVYLTWEERLQYDLEYVVKMSLSLDVKIILRTIYLIIVGEEKGRNMI
jgi:undecaprenyl phosphate N,N'-diacetylbacillosamine 1-phosphate transferase